MFKNNYAALDLMYFAKLPNSLRPALMVLCKSWFFWNESGWPDKTASWKAIKWIWKTLICFLENF